MKKIMVSLHISLLCLITHLTVKAQVPIGPAIIINNMQCIPSARILWIGIPDNAIVKDAPMAHFRVNCGPGDMGSCRFAVTEELWMRAIGADWQLRFIWCTDVGPYSCGQSNDDWVMLGSVADLIGAVPLALPDPTEPVDVPTGNDVTYWYGVWVYDGRCSTAIPNRIVLDYQYIEFPGDL